MSNQIITADSKPAIVELIAPGCVRIFPHHPEWNGDPRTFAAAYTLVNEVVVPCVGRPPPRKFIGPSEPRTCTFCGLGEPAVTFRKDAHTVPASLGNRHHFTREECDSCNHKHGALDDAVANFFAIERVVIGARKREGAPNIVGRDGTFARYDHELGRVSIVVDSSRDDADTRVDLSKPKTIALTTRCPGFSFDDLAREMARLSWMMLLPEQRRESSEYLHIVGGYAVPSTPWQLFKTFAPGAPYEVRFRLWRARQADIASTVAAVTVGPSTLIWTSCDGSSLEHRPGPLPAFDADATFGEPSMQWLPIPPGTIQETTSQMIELGYNELVPGLLPPRPASPKGTTRPHYDAVFRWQSDDAEQRLTTNVDIQRNDGKVTRLWIDGGELCATLAITAVSGRPAATGEFELRLAGQSIAAATRTLDLLDALRNGGAMLEANGGSWQVANLELPATFDLATTRLRLDRLRAIESALGMALTVPDADDRESWLACRLLAAAINNGGIVVRERRSTLNFLVSEETAAPLEPGGELEGSIVLDQKPRWTIDGTDVDAGNVRVTMPAARLVSKIPVDHDGERSVRLEFVGEMCRYEFARWLVPDAIA